MDGQQKSRPAAPLDVAETAFEKRRGISSVETRPGFAQVHIANLGEPLIERRLDVLTAVADAAISLDFLKFTQTGISFLVADSFASKISQVLSSLKLDFTLEERRHILMVHAVNMRDEEGLIARIVLEAIASGVRVSHVSDMHDRMLMVVTETDALTLKTCIEEHLMGVAVAH